MAGLRIFRVIALLCCALWASVFSAMAEDIVGIPTLSYRTGLFAPTGISLVNGQRDYLTMINERDGGINGVRLGYEECETGFSVDKGVECYKKTRATGIVTQPGSPAIALSLMSMANSDRIPLLAPGYGFSPISDGARFKWSFNPPVTQWEGMAMILQYISSGNLAALRGRKVALLYLDTVYGEEPAQLLQSLSQRYGFAFVPVPVSAREMQNQTMQWRKIEDEDPDFVLVWGWGAMNATVLAEATKAKFPMDRLVGIWWSPGDEDLQKAGQAAKGYRMLSWNLPVSDGPAMMDVRRYVLDPGKAGISEDQFNSVLYQRGLLTSMFVVEAIRNAQERFNSKIVNAEQLRWGLENLRLDDERLAEIGMTGMIAPFEMSCAEHSGRGGAWILEWDGTRLVQASDVLHADRTAFSSLVDQAAEDFIGANEPWPVSEDCPS